MKQYEYKFVRSKAKLGFDYQQKLTEIEAEWNELGASGWKFCTWANDAAVFIRELKTDSNALCKSDIPC